jgi:hypothetical protein
MGTTVPTEIAMIAIVVVIMIAIVVVEVAMAVTTTIVIVVIVMVAINREVDITIEIVVAAMDTNQEAVEVVVVVIITTIEEVAVVQILILEVIYKCNETQYSSKIYQKVSLTKSLKKNSVLLESLRMINELIHQKFGFIKIRRVERVKVKQLLRTMMNKQQRQQLIGSIVN